MTGKKMAKNQASLPLGIVLEWRAVDNPWIDHEWRPVAVIPGAPEVDAWKVLNRGNGWIHYHAGTLPLELHRQETAAYRYNLASQQPVIYVVLRQGEEAGEREVAPFLVTASPSEAQDILDAGDDIVEGVPMPEVIMAWAQAFVAEHHVDEPHYKRKRERLDPDKVSFGAPGRQRRSKGRR